MNFQRVLLKLSGEALAGANGFGFDAQVMSEYAKSIADAATTGTQIAIVIGGGNIYRGEQGAQTGKWRVKGDQMGMLATVINGLALAETFEKEHCATQVFSAFPTGPVATPYSVEGVEEATKSSHPYSGNRQSVLYDRFGGSAPCNRTTLRCAFERNASRWRIRLRPREECRCAEVRDAHL